MNAPADSPASPIETCRHDGWTQDRRRLFLEALAEGRAIERACAHVGMSKVSAYKLRRRDPGFALAWSTALNTIRSRGAFGLTNPPVLDRIKVVVRKNGTIVRRLDNRRALAELLRIDRRIARLDAAASRGIPHNFNNMADLGAG